MGFSICGEPVKLLSPVQLFGTPWTVAYQASPSVEFSRQQYWSGLSFPSSGDLPDPGIEPRSPALQRTLYCLSHQGSPVVVQGLSCPPGMWNLPRPRMEPMFPALGGRLHPLYYSGGGPLSLVSFSSEKESLWDGTGPNL